MAVLMIINLCSAKTIEEYSKALYIKLNYCVNNKNEIPKFQTKLKLNIKTIQPN